MARKNRPVGYGVYACEHLRDGIEEYGRLFDNLPDALAWINKVRTGFAGDNHTFKLFELGRELQLEFADVEVPQPPKVAKHVRLKRGGNGNALRP